jgi:hypothetical protein
MLRCLVWCVGLATRVFRTRWHGKSDLILHSSPGDLPQRLFVLPTQHSNNLLFSLGNLGERIMLKPHHVQYPRYAVLYQTKWKHRQINAHSFQL